MANTVPLEDLAGRLGGSTLGAMIAQLDLLGAKPTTDSIGRIAVTEAIAAKLVKRYDAEEKRRLELQAEHHAFVANREARRQAVCDEAFQAALKKTLKRQGEWTQQASEQEAWVYFPVDPNPTPQTLGVARQARMEAAREFDRVNPERLLGFEAWLEQHEESARMKGAL
jgi:hypothetical protein